MEEKDNTSAFLAVKDHSVSGKTFQLVYNKEMEMLETFPRPKLEDLPKYYESPDYISHTDSKRNLFENIYQFVKSITLKRKLALINSQAKDDRSLLDIGCGTGDFLKTAMKSKWAVSGIEPNEQARKLANEKTNNSVFDVEKLLEFEANSFSVITLWHVLEHLPNLEEQFNTFNKLLKPDGSLIIAVPNYKSYDANYYKDFWAAFDVPRHLWHFSQHSISKLAKRHNMEVINIFPMKFDAYYVCLLSEKYKSVKMNFLRALWFGWRSNRRAKRSGEYSSLIYILKKKNI